MKPLQLNWVVWLVFCLVGHKATAGNDEPAVSIYGDQMAHVFCVSKYPEVDYRDVNIADFISDLRVTVTNIEWDGKPPELMIGPKVLETGARLNYAGMNVPILVVLAAASKQFGVDIEIRRGTLTLSAKGSDAPRSPPK